MAKKPINKSEVKDDENENDKTGSRRARSNGKRKSSKRNYSNDKSNNDPSWYSVNSQLLKDAGSFSYFTPSGTKINLDNRASDLTNQLSSMSAGGVSAIAVLNGPGYSNDEYSPVNVAARNLYTFVRHANSGHTNYDAPDLMMYLLAMDQAYSLYAFMVRAYGCLRLYNQMSRYYPKGIIESMNLDPDDFIKNLADFRYFINSFAIKLGSLCVPATMSYFVRHLWMFSNIYLDDESSKAQLYMYVPYGFYHYDEYESSNGGQLVFDKFWKETVDGGVSVPWTYETLTAYANKMLNGVLASEDMNIMSGDILKAFGSNNLFKVSTIAEDYVVMPVYNKEVLSQIQNTTLIGRLNEDSDEGGSMDITQNPNIGAGYIIFKPTILTPTDVENQNFNWERAMMLATKRILTMPSDDVKPEDTMVATRMTVIPEIEVQNTGDNNVNVSVLTSFGTELALFVRTCRFDNNVKDEWSIVFSDDINMCMFSNVVVSTTSKQVSWTAFKKSLHEQTRFAAMWKQHPCLYFASQITVDGKVYDGPTYDYMLFDLNNYTVIDYTDLQKLHETALLSEFAVPLLGYSTK